MKKILCFAALLGFINHASAQNSNPWPTTGNVGIGTATPATPLHVSASSAVAGFSNITVDNSGATGNESAIAFKAGYNTSSLNSGRIYSLFDGGTSYNNARTTIQSLLSGGVYNNTLTVRNGKVGLGNINPLAPLHVQGGGTTTGIADIGTSLTARFNTANPPITLGIGYVSSDNPFLQAFNSTNNTANHLIINPFGGNVGIGNASPTYTIDITGSGKTGRFVNTATAGTSGSASVLIDNSAITSNLATSYALQIATSVNANAFSISNSGIVRSTILNVNNGTTTGSAFTVASSSTNVGSGVPFTLIDASSITSNIATSYALQIKTQASAGSLVVLNNGNVGVGITNPTDKLAVNGTIHTKEVRVDLTGWADYVFKKDYKLPSLTEVKGYIDKNQHLPGMPSEKEVMANGLNLGEMNKILTKKVEELTLYLIEKDKELTQQNQTNKSQQKEIDTLKEQFSAILAKLSLSTGNANFQK